MSKKGIETMNALSSAFKSAGAIWKAVDAWTSQGNHPAWYAHYPVAGLVQLNFGRRESSRSADPDSLILSEAGFTVPCPRDAVIDVYLTSPKVQGSTDPLDEAAGIILNQMRSVATTTAPYDTADIRRYLENLRVIMAAYAQVRRLADCLGIADSYDEDAFYKYALACLPNGVQYANVITEKAQLEAALSAMTPTLVNLFPAQVDVIERMKWLFANVFCDSPSAKFNAKQFRCTRWELLDSNGNPHMFFTEEFTIRSDNHAAQTTTTLPNEFNINAPNVTGKKIYGHRVAATPLGLVNMVRRMIGLMLEDPSASRIAGDLLKAFGQQAFMVIPAFEPNKRVPFVYDEDVLNQIQNATVFGDATYATSGFSIDADTPIDRRSDILATNENYVSAALAEHAVTTYRNEVDSPRLLTLTRMSPFAVKKTLHENPSDLTQTTTYLTPNTMGTDVILAYSYVSVSGSMADLSMALVPASINTATSTASIIRFIVQAWSSDDWAPLMMLRINNISGMPPVSAIDVQNWAVMNEKDQAAYTNVATLSLYTIPILVSKQDTFAFVG